ncbi:hypothetical protein ACFLXI_08900 [Chloroflexota bacterium]
MSESFINISGYLNILSGVCLLIYWYAFAILLPYRELSTTLSILVKNPNWIWINALGVFGALAGLLGQAGIYVIQMTHSSWYTTAGFYIATLGTTLLIGTMLWDTILWPILVKHNESLLDFRGPIYSSKIFIPYFVAAGIVYSLGYILVGTGIYQTGVLPAVAGFLIAVGAPAFGLGSLFGKYQVYVRSFGITVMSAGLIWIGIGILF